MDSFIIKEATLQDVDLIHTMGQCFFTATYQSILEPEQIEYMLDWMYSCESLVSQMNSGVSYYIISYEGKVCGYYSLGEATPGCFVLHKLYIDPNTHGKGVGREVFNSISKKLKEYQLATVTLELNVNRNNSKAISFYERIGMERVREGDFYIGNGYYMNDYVYRITL